MIGINERLFDDFVDFGVRMIRSEDIDPLYPYLRALYIEMELTDEQRLWFSFLYVATYNVASAFRLFQIYPNLGYVGQDVIGTKTGVERRGHRGDALFTHINDYVRKVEMYGTQRAWIEQCYDFADSDILSGWSADETAYRNALYRTYERWWTVSQTVYGNGRWATFKWGEILRKVHSIPFNAPDMRLKYSGKAEAKPARCLNILSTTPMKSVPKLNAYAKTIQDAVLERTEQLWDWDTLETVLCNFHSLVGGRYYIGHDIDELQHVIQRAPLIRLNRNYLMDIRKTVYAPEYLGEVNGWSGVDKALKIKYKQTGTIGDRKWRQ